MNYNEWENWFLRANKRKHDAAMRLFQLEDSNETNSESYRAWKKEEEQWKECEHDAINDYPHHYRQYLQNRGTSAQTSASATANGSKHQTENSASTYLGMVIITIGLGYWAFHGGGGWVWAGFLFFLLGLLGNLKR